MNRARKPAVFRLDDPAIVVTPSGEPRSIAPPADFDPLPAAPPPPRRRVPWAGLFWVSAAGLLLLATGLGIANLIEDLLNRAAWLGSVGAVLAAVAVVALVAIVTREVLGLARLAAIETLRQRAAAILVSDDRAAGRALGRDLITLTRRMPRLARGRARLESHLGDIIDGGDLVRLSERELMTPIDAEARRLVAAAAKRVSVVTAVSPRAAVDMFFVLITALGLVRRLALLYGGRPGTLGLISDGRHGGKRQPDPASDRPRSRRQAVRPARRGRSQWAADSAARPCRHRGDATASVRRAAATRAERHCGLAVARERDSRHRGSFAG